MIWRIALSEMRSKIDAATKCGCCGLDLTTANDSQAHFIPNALGGRLKSKGLICQTCNTELDAVADNALVKAYGDWPTLLDIPRDRGDNPPKLIETRDGKRVRLERDGSMIRIDTGRPTTPTRVAPPSSATRT